MAYIVSFSGSSFDVDTEQTPCYLVENSYVDVTCFNRLHAYDDSGRANSLLARKYNNLFEMKRRVLASIVGWRLELPDDEEPIEIAATVKAVRAGKPEFLQASEKGVYAGFLPVTFSAPCNLNAIQLPEQ